MDIRTHICLGSDVKEFREIIDDGQAALVIVGESNLDKADMKAEKHIAEETRCEFAGH